MTAESYARAGNWAAYAPNGQSTASFFEHIEGFEQVHPANPDGESSSQQAPPPPAKEMPGLRVLAPTTLQVKMSRPFASFPVMLGYTAFSRTRRHRAGQIMNLLDELGRDRGMELILSTHDLGVVAEIADRIAVMYAGRVVEAAGAASLYRRPAHPYTEGLMRSLPRLDSHKRELAPSSDCLRS